MADDQDRTAAFMSPAKLAQIHAAARAAPPQLLEQFPADAGQEQVVRLGELRRELQSQAVQRDYGVVIDALGRLAAALPQLDFGLLEPKGWLARATGKARTSGVEFASQFDRVVQVAKVVRDQAQSLLRQHQAQSAVTERTLVEFEVERQAIEQIQEPATRWLQEMRGQLKARQAAAADEAAQRSVREEAAHCEQLVGQLKRLRSVVTVAQAAHDHGHRVAGHRGALLQSLQQLRDQDIKAWEARLAPVATAATDSGAPANLDEARAAHRELASRVEQIIATCRQLQGEEQALAAQLAALGDEVTSAG